MVNTALLTSEGIPVADSETLTRALEEGVFGTNQDSVPSFEVLAAIVIQVEPELVEYSNFTFATVPVEVQVIL
jgi:hypothetical protein